MALDVATALLRVVGASTSDAAHLAGAIGRHRREMRLEGSSVPPTLDALEQVFARIAIGSRKVTGGHSGPEIDAVSDPGDGRSHESPTDLLDRKQAARRLRCSESTVKRREAAGELRPIRHGRVVRHRVTDLDAYLEGTRTC